MPDVERRFLPQAAAAIKLEERADGATQISGVGSVFYDGTPATEYQLWPGVVERIMPGAFDKVLKDRTEDTVGLFNHNPDNLLGRRSAKTLRLRRMKDGLHYYIEADDTTVGQDVAKHVERGDLTGSSFSFIVETEEWRLEDGIEIREIQSVFPLFDVGPVTFPAYKSTSVSARSEARLKAWREEREQASEGEVEGDPEPEVRKEPKEIDPTLQSDADRVRKRDAMWAAIKLDRK